MDEHSPGDRISICELLDCISFLSDEKWLRAHWSINGTFSSFESLLGIIFDDFNIRIRADMAPGYLGTPVQLPQQLSDIANLLDEFESVYSVERESDLELLAIPEWKSISLASKAIADSTRAWRLQHCAIETPESS